MALTKKGTLAFGFGAGGLTAPTVSTISAITSAEATSEASLNVPARNATGETVAHAYGDEKVSLRVEGYHTAATLPTVGAAMTVAGKGGFAQRVSINASNQDFVKLSVEGDGYVVNAV